VSSSYMCKSQLGMCFTHVKVKDGVKSIVSGCADSLQEEPQMRTCAGTGNGLVHPELPSNDTSGADDVIADVTGEGHHAAVVESGVRESGSSQHLVEAVPEASLRCCTLDMCNYRDSNEITITIDTKTNDNGRMFFLLHGFKKLDIWVIKPFKQMIVKILYVPLT